MKKDIEILKRALVREKKARKEAEETLEKKSLELYQINQNLEAVIKKRTAALEEAKLLAEKASQDKSEFLAKVSHEIRTPVMGIVGFCDQLKNIDLDTNSLHDLSNNIYSSSSLLVSILDDTFDYFKIENGGIILREESVDLRLLISDLVRILDSLAKEKNLVLNTQVDHLVPDLIKIDDKRLSQILINLIVNAIKYTDKGSVSLKFSLSSQNSLCIDIVDTGIGMSQEVFEKIYKSFFQADFNASGLGLGMNIVKTFTELMKGEIKMTSELDRGTHFNLTIPFEKVTSRKKISKEFEIGFELGSLLLVEDNLINQKILSSYLKDIFKKITIVSTLQAALKTINSNNFDLCILDYQLPDGTGADFLKLAAKDLSNVGKTIVLTASEFDDFRNECFDLGADKFLLKPIQKRRLIGEIKLLFS